ncbi:MAG TPA: TonB family protein [Blastocatellia bacterium]
MRRSCITAIWLACFFSFAFARQSSQAAEKELGIELYRKGNFNEAAKALQKAVKKEKKDFDAWYYLGLSSHRAGKIADAIEAFEKALSLRTDFAPAYAAMAYMRLIVNDNKRAVENADKALALDAKNFEALYVAGAARLRDGRPAEALARAEEALNLKVDHPQALMLKTQALLGIFAEEYDRWTESRGQGEEGKSAGAGEPKRRADYSLLRSASKSLEAYMKLGLQESNREFLSEQLEALRCYASMEGGSGPDNAVAPYKPVLQWPGTQKPTILHREKARYTDAAVAAGIQGTVKLLVVFADDGVIKNILVLRGLSHGLTEEAIKAARKIRFTPAMINGKPASVFGSLEFSWGLGKP